MAALASLLGGATIRVDPIRDTDFSLGLDWFVISLFFSALVFIPIERLLAVRPMSPLRAEGRLHAVHDSSRNLDWLAGSRVHLVEIVLTRSSVLLPLVILGFSQAAMNAYVILVGVQAVLAHANLRTHFGWLEYLLVVPRYHRWHHARHADYIDVNYAIHLPLVDMIMGTFKRPPPGAWADEYGVMKRDTVPRGFWAQALMPMRSRRTSTDHVGAE